MRISVFPSPQCLRAPHPHPGCVCSHPGLVTRGRGGMLITGICGIFPQMKSNGEMQHLLLVCVVKVRKTLQKSLRSQRGEGRSLSSSHGEIGPCPCLPVVEIFLMSVFCFGFFWENKQTKTATELRKKDVSIRLTKLAPLGSKQKLQVEMSAGFRAGSPFVDREI